MPSTTSVISMNGSSSGLLGTSDGCANFSENAWRKGVCTECFRSKDEHQEVDRGSSSPYASTSSATWKNGYNGRGGGGNGTDSTDSSSSGLRSPGLLKTTSLLFPRPFLTEFALGGSSIFSSPTNNNNNNETTTISMNRDSRITSWSRRSEKGVIETRFSSSSPQLDTSSSSSMEPRTEPDGQSFNSQQGSPKESSTDEEPTPSDKITINPSDEPYIKSFLAPTTPPTLEKKPASWLHKLGKSTETSALEASQSRYESTLNVNGNSGSSSFPNGRSLSTSWLASNGSQNSNVISDFRLGVTRQNSHPPELPKDPPPTNRLRNRRSPDTSPDPPEPESSPSPTPSPPIRRSHASPLPPLPEKAPHPSASISRRPEEEAEEDGRRSASPVKEEIIKTRREVANGDAPGDPAILGPPRRPQRRDSTLRRNQNKPQVKPILKLNRGDKRIGSVTICDSGPAVIGYGGDVDYGSDEEEEEEVEEEEDEEGWSDGESDDRSCDLTQEERQLRDLTLQHTDFNGIAANLMVGPIPPCNQAPAKRQSSLDETTTNETARNGSGGGGKFAHISKKASSSLLPASPGRGPKPVVAPKPPGLSQKMDRTSTGSQQAEVEEGDVPQTKEDPHEDPLGATDNGVADPHSSPGKHGNRRSFSSNLEALGHELRTLQYANSEPSCPPAPPGSVDIKGSSTTTVDGSRSGNLSRQSRPSSTKRPAPKPPGRPPPPPTKNNVTTNGIVTIGDDRNGNKRGPPPKKPPPPSRNSAGNSSAPSFSIFAQKHGSPSPERVRKPRSRSLPRPADFFLNRERRRRSGRFSPTCAVSTSPDIGRRSKHSSEDFLDQLASCKFKRRSGNGGGKKNFIRKLLRIGGSSSKSSSTGSDYLRDPIPDSSMTPSPSTNHRSRSRRVKTTSSSLHNGAYDDPVPYYASTSGPPGDRGGQSSGGVQLRSKRSLLADEEFIDLSPRLPNRRFSDQDALLADGREAYANLGNTRSSLTPKKPQRTGSLRENKQPVQPSPYAVGVLQEDAGNNSPTFKVTTSASNVVYAAPNKNRAVSKGGPMANRSPTRALEVDQPDRFSSLSHRLPSSRNHSPSFKLGQRAKLEDTYGAVVSANYQALSQMLDRIREAPLLPGCDSLEDALARTTSSSVAWSDFRRDSKTQTVIIGDSKYFIPVLYDEGTKGTVLATLLPLLTGHSVAPPSRSQPAPLSFPFIPQPLVSFTEPLPSEGLPLRGDTVHLFLFPRLLVSPFPPSLSSSGRGETEGAGVKGGTTSPDEREACFQLLQMITALRSLHAQGYKEVSYSLDSFVSVRGDGETHWRLLLVQENDPERKRSDFGESISLCSAACLALFRLIGWDTDEAITCVTNDEEMPSLSIMDAPEVFGVVTSLLSETGPLQTASSPASCLIKARGVLECHLWGPWVSPNATEEASEDNLEAGFQRWLDLERAQVLNTFVRNAGKGTRDVLEEYHLEFLVSATASSLMESWNLLHESAS